MNSELAKVNQEIKPAEQMRLATDCAGVCREIVKRTAIRIKGRHYVKVEGWQSIATAHGCVAGTRDVERIETGYRAIGELRRTDTGELIATAEGFVGDDEKMWQNRNEFAKRAMAQTRAISRVCRSAFAHVVVLIDSNLSTTPAEEMYEGDTADVGETHATGHFKRGTMDEERRQDEEAGLRAKREIEQDGPVNWKNAKCSFGKNKGVTLGAMTDPQRDWYADEWLPKRQVSERPPTAEDIAFANGLLEYKRQRGAPPMTSQEFQAERDRQEREAYEGEIPMGDPAEYGDAS